MFNEIDDEVIRKRGNFHVYADHFEYQMKPVKWYHTTWKSFESAKYVADRTEGGIIVSSKKEIVYAGT